MSNNYNVLIFNILRKTRIDLSVIFLMITMGVTAQSLKPLGIDSLEANSRLGHDVELSGTTAYVSAPYQNVADNSRQGVLYLFDGKTDWALKGSYTAPDGTAFDKFGYSISAYQNELAVSAPGNSSGAVYIYSNLNDELTITQIIEPYVESDHYFNSMEFGSVVKLTENYLFASAPYFLKSAAVVDASVYVYERTGEGWTFKQRLTNPDDQPASLFGYALDAHGDQLVIGAPKANGGADQSGAAYLYELVGGEWQYTFKFQYPDSYSHERFGLSVGIHENQVIIGSINHVFEADKGPEGTAHTFVKAGSSWFHTGTLTSSTPERNSRLGEQVAIVKDYAVITTGRSSHSNKTHAGSVHIYKQENGFWQEVYYLRPDSSNVQAYMYFGGAIDVSDNHLLVGAHLEDYLNEDSGNAYVHELETVVSTEDPLIVANDLFAIAPNPFRSELDITWDLPADLDLTLEAFDARGQFVQSIYTGQSNWRPDQTVRWSPAKVVPGIYYIRLQAGRYVSTLKAVCIH